MLAYQVDARVGPFCPPDTTAVIDDQPHVFSCAITARNAYINHMEEDRQKRKYRCYWDGALYRRLFNGFYDTIYSERGECCVDIMVEGKFKGRTMVFWSLATDSRNQCLPQLRNWCVSNITTSHGNCRRKTLDLGTMVVLGWRARNQVPYKSNDRVTDIGETMVLATKHFRELFPNVVRDISIRTIYARSRITGLDKSAVSEMIVSKDLVNSSHIDFQDKSYSITTWMEAAPGQTKEKYFILPFTTRDGSKSLVFPIVDGQSIAWDGRILQHCSSEGCVGPNNSVYGLFFGSK